MTSDFFDTPMVKANAEEADFLRKRLEKYAALIQKNPGDRDVVIEYFHTLYALVEKEEILYTRMTLAEDSEVQERMKGLRSLLTELKATGLARHDTMPEVFDVLKKELRTMLKQLDDPDLDLLS